RHSDRSGLQNRHDLEVLTLDLLRTHIQGREIDVIDKILRRQLQEPDRVGPAVPVEMHCTAATRIEPFVESARQGWTADLVDCRQQDKNVGMIKEPPQGSELFIR